MEEHSDMAISAFQSTVDYAHLMFDSKLQNLLERVYGVLASNRVALINADVIVSGDEYSEGVLLDCVLPISPTAVRRSGSGLQGVSLAGGGGCGSLSE